MLETEEKIRKNIVTFDEEDEIQLRYISDESERSAYGRRCGLVLQNGTVLRVH